ncbi:MAG: response regulator [Bacteroidetes bacterium]|nr:response regulator [Bacteroidota bacterium]
MSVPVRILVVDDEPDLEALVRQRFRRQIRANEFDFLFAADGVDALDLINEDQSIDIVLTDINMPRMDGLTLLQRLSEVDRVLIAVVVSAYGDMDNIRVAMNRGSFDFLTKPIDLQDLEITVKKASDVLRRLKTAATIRDTFSRYISHEVVNELLTRPDAIELGGELREVTLMMSDLRGFSAISEQLPPDRVVELLNVYLGFMVDVVQRHGGVIDNFMGDGLLTVFGAPVARGSDASDAIACAIDMQLAMADVNRELGSRGLPALEVGIGIDTGNVVVGNIGSQKRMKYSVIGSHVNLVSRIESFTTGGQILISDGNRRASTSDVDVEDALEIAAKGFSEAIEAYLVKGIGEPYNLRAPRFDDPALPVPAPFNVVFRTIGGKTASGETHEGRVVALSRHSADVSTKAPVDVFCDLVFPVTLAESGSEAMAYAKVVGKSGELLNLRFTSVTAPILDEWQTRASA